MDRCIDCQICVSNRWTDKIQSKFEGKIWSRKSIFRELVDCQHSYFIWVIGSKFNYAIKKIKTGFCFLSWTNDFLFGFFMGLGLVFKATFNNISVLLLKETRAPRENHWLVTSHWQTLSHNVVSSTHRLTTPAPYFLFEKCWK